MKQNTKNFDIRPTSARANIYDVDGALNHFAPRAIEVNASKDSGQKWNVRRVAATAGLVAVTAGAAFGAMKGAESVGHAIGNMPNEAQLEQSNATADRAAQDNVSAFPAAANRPDISAAVENATNK